MEKDRVEILQRFADIKAESKMQKVALERSSETVPELKMLLERSEQQRGISSLPFSLSLYNEFKTHKQI